MAKVALIIARMQPLHIGHQKLIQFALLNFSHVIIAIGSHNCARNMRNPFTSIERSKMLTELFPSQIVKGKISIVQVEDFLHNDGRWVDHLKEQLVQPFTKQGITFEDLEIVGHEKDEHIYIELFPEV